MERPCNDDVNAIFDWLYLGGISNTRKTIRLVDVWYDFKWDQREPRNLEIPASVMVHRKPFDDGDLDKAIAIWRECFVEILEYKRAEKRVFISCSEGVSRSAVLGIWLACEELGDYEVALKHVKSCRNVFPDKAFQPFLQWLATTYKKRE